MLQSGSSPSLQSLSVNFARLRMRFFLIWSMEQSVRHLHWKFELNVIEFRSSSDMSLKEKFSLRHFLHSQWIIWDASVVSSAWLDNPEHLLWTSERQQKQGKALEILSEWIFLSQIEHMERKLMDFSCFLVNFSSWLSKSSFLSCVSSMELKGEQRQSGQNQEGEFVLLLLKSLYWSSETRVHLI